MVVSLETRASSACVICKITFARAKLIFGLFSFADIADEAGKYFMPIAR